MERMNERLVIEMIMPNLEGSQLSISSHIVILELLAFLAMSSCVGLLPAPDDYLGSSPSMVHHCRMSWASATQSGHVPSARTCSQVPSARTGGTPKSLQLGLVANVPLVLSIVMVRIPSPASSISKKTASTGEQDDHLSLSGS
ncbi:hypothetical protein PIB30_047507 [Stylosanthes scabra]|uniref:Uncharacterized protein n=2 Tax=Stylosanthes scabra TaxID=79078 RepID=A0ABU6VFV6_9FABA|nr:hypothetical protein [Stylosanthes scabra]